MPSPWMELRISCSTPEWCCPTTWMTKLREAEAEPPMAEPRWMGEARM